MELEREMGAAEFWRSAKDGGREAADGKIKLLGELKDVVARFRTIERGVEEFAGGAHGEGKFSELKKQFRELELETLFAGPYDRQAALVSIYPGAGGEDAEDWARMLSLMYARYAERRGWKAERIDDNPRSRTFTVRGTYAYGYLRRESGVHRLVRISPFSPKKLRHTSFALVEVVPELPPLEESKIQIPPEDMKLEFSRSGGPGGQNVNKVETAVRVVHLPTGVAVSARAERSQAQNREQALRLLKAKLFKLMEENQVEELGKLRVKVKPEWGNQIRSYVLNPYHLVKDVRTGVETAQVDEVLGGNLDEFIEAEVELLA